MNVINNNIFEGAVDIAKVAINFLKEHAEALYDKVKDEYAPLLSDFVKNMTGEIKGIAYGQEVDQLDLTTLLAFAKEHIVEGANEVAAMRVKEENGWFIYLAYAKDRELLPSDTNRYLILKANSLAQDVEELFKESELIILK